MKELAPTTTGEGLILIAAILVIGLCIAAACELLHHTLTTKEEEPL